jgi:predicted phosphate transport protein (TIGR00153 family)
LSDVKGILDWFARRKNDNVQANGRNHAVAILDTASEVENALTAMAAGDSSAALKCIDRVLLAENEADQIEDRLCFGITDGTLSVQEREDLLRLVRMSDNVADWSNQAGIYVQMSIDTGIAIPAYLWEAAKEMASELILASKMLVKAYENLGVNYDEVKRCIAAIKDQESTIDQMYYSLFRKILTSDMDYKGVMLMRGIIDGLENASDACKDCADMMAILMSARGA